MSKLFLAALSLASTASAQCDIIDQTFDSFAPGTALDALQGWQDQSPGQVVLLGTNPDNNSTAIVFGTGTNIVRRRIGNVGLGERFRVSSDIRVDRDGAFRFQCAPVIQGNQVFMNYRVVISFDASAASPVIRYNYYGTTAAATLPLVVGTPTRLEIDVDTQGNAVTYYNGEVLAVEAWATGGPFPCSRPQDAVWLSLASGTGAGMVVDNVCVGGPFATNYCTAVPNSTGVISRISALGTPSFSANDMMVSTTDLPDQSFGLYVTSRTQGFTPNAGGSTGNLCLGGAAGRYALPINSGGNGAIMMSVNWTALPQPNGLAQASTGETWNFQLWHRDTEGGVATSNFSEGIQVTVTP